MKSVLHFRNSARQPAGATANEYDLCIDTGKIGIEKAAELILQYIKYRK